MKSGVSPLTIYVLVVYFVPYFASVTSAGDDTNSVKSVLMVCSANHVLSPMAEAIFEHLAKNKGVHSQWRCDSAGLGDTIDGDEMSENAAIKLREYGIEPPANHTSREATEDDFKRYDFALAMDKENLRDMRGLALVGSTAKMELLPSYDPEGKPIIKHPNFWSKLPAFEECFHTINRSCNAFLDKHSNFKAVASESV